MIDLEYGDRILAVDWSLSNTGMCFPDGTHDSLRPPGNLEGPARLEWWRSAWMDILRWHKPDHCVFELPFTGMQRTRKDGKQVGDGDTTLRLGKLYGVIELQTWKWGQTLAQMTPTWIHNSTIKKHATGRGNAKKEEVLSAVQRRWNYGGTDHNVADAIALWHLAHELRGN